MITELIAIFGMAVTILATMWAMFRSLRAEMLEMRIELRNEIKYTHAEIISIRTNGIPDLKADFLSHFLRLDENQRNINERMAHLEGLLEGLREAITGRSAA